MDKIEIRSKLKNVAELATLSPVALRAIQILNDSEVNVGKVTETVTLDQSMTAKILKLVNSSFYGFQGKISSLSQAIILLGFNTVRSIILSVSVLQTFSGGAKCSLFDIGRFWEHSVGTAFIAKRLAEQVRYRQPEDAFVAGLLHDVGRVFIIQFLRSEFERIVVLRKEQDLSIREAEEKVLGVDHSWIGGTIVKNWNFPSDLCCGIGYHHAPDALANREDGLFSASIIHLSDILCRGLNLGFAGDDFVPEVNIIAWEKLSLSLEDVKRLVKRIGQELYQIEDFLAVLTSDHS